MADANFSSFGSNTKGKDSDRINKIEVRYTIDTADIALGAVFINSLKSPEDTIVGKIFIYKSTNPKFIEVNFDESYIRYLFEDCASASHDIADYTLKMLTLDFPGSLLSMSSSNDIGLVKLPESIYKRKNK